MPRVEEETHFSHKINQNIIFLTRDEQIFRNGSEQIFEYIRKTETSLNEYWIYLNNLNFHDWIFEYICGPKFYEYLKIYSGQKVKNTENMLKKITFRGIWNNLLIKFSWIYSEYKANILIYSNINNEIIWIQIFI